MLNYKLPPLVHKPAPALISPVDFSSILIFTIFKFFCEPSDTLDVTLLKIFLDFKFEIDLSKFIFVNGSPSSSSSSPRITSSFVTELPSTIIFSIF